MRTYAEKQIERVLKEVDRLNRNPLITRKEYVECLQALLQYARNNLEMEKRNTEGRDNG